jgi:hypothetical protein
LQKPAVFLTKNASFSPNFSEFFFFNPNIGPWNQSYDFWNYSTGVECVCQSSGK